MPKNTEDESAKVNIANTYTKLRSEFIRQENFNESDGSIQVLLAPTVSLDTIKPLIHFFFNKVTEEKNQALIVKLLLIEIQYKLLLDNEEYHAINYTKDNIVKDTKLKQSILDIVSLMNNLKDNNPGLYQESKNLLLEKLNSYNATTKTVKVNSSAKSFKKNMQRNGEAKSTSKKYRQIKNKVLKGLMADESNTNNKVPANLVKRIKFN